MSRPALIVRVAARMLPADYRDEILSDVLDRGGSTWHIVAAIVRSTIDARSATRTKGRMDMNEHGSVSALVSNLRMDLRGSVRAHSAKPASAIAIVATLALTIGVTTALFSVVDAVLLRPLPFKDADRVVFVWNVNEGGGIDTQTPARALDIRHEMRSLDGAAMISHLSQTITGRRAAERWAGASVSGNFFDVLGSTAVIGRTFTGSDADRAVVVLSDRLWRQQFNSDPAVIGQSITMNGTPRTVLGVMSGDFYWPAITGTPAPATDAPLFWTMAALHDVPSAPMDFQEDITQNRHMGFLRLVARVHSGVTLAAAQSEASDLSKRLGERYPSSDAGRNITLVPAREQFFGAVQKPLSFVLLASVVVVIVACVNIGNLLLVRLASRRREFTLRSALGAGRRRLVAQLVIEASSLAAVGGLGGIAVARAALSSLISLAPATVGRLDRVSLSPAVLLAALAATTLTALLLAAVSVAAIPRSQHADDLRGGAAAALPGRLRSGLVAVEIALAVALTTGAGLFAQSLLRLEHVDVGFDTRSMLTFDAVLTGERALFQSRQLAFYDPLLDRIRAIPGVVAASGAATLPIGGDDFGVSVFAEGRPLPPPGHEPRIGYQIVEGGWFETLGMTVLAGRDFGRADTRETYQVALINKALADLVFPGENPIGRRVKYARESDAPLLTIVGVVSDIRHMGPAIRPRPELYQAYSQSSFPFMAIAVRTSVDPSSIAPAIREAAREVDPTQPLSGISTMQAHLDRAYSSARFLSALTLLFGGLALLLAIIGVYGVTTCAIAQRTREFGVRTALGARPAQLIRGILRGGLTPVAIGAVCGVALALLFSGAVRSLLFDTAPLDPASYAAAALVMLATAAAAVLVPAARAARIDPVRALRDS